MMVNQEGHMYDDVLSDSHSSKIWKNTKALRLRQRESHGIQGANNETWPMILDFGNFLMRTIAGLSLCS